MGFGEKPTKEHVTWTEGKAPAQIVHLRVRSSGLRTFPSDRFENNYYGQTGFSF